MDNDFYKNLNINPHGRRVGDCSVRAIAAALNEDWDTTFLRLVIEAFKVKDMPSANSVWGAVLRQNGFTRKLIEEAKCDCYTVSDFAKEHPHGTYVLALSSHVVAVVDGEYLDTWDSGDEVPIYYWERIK